MKNSERPLSESIDLYKFTMGDMILHKHPDAQVRFTLANRGLKNGQRISDVVHPDEYREQLENIRKRGFGPDETFYLSTLRNSSDGGPLLRPGYIDFLSDIRMPEVEVGTDPTTGEITAFAEGDWPSVSLWETVMMRTLSTMYAEKKMAQIGLTMTDIHVSFDQHITRIVSRLKEYPRKIEFSEFGTRRCSFPELQEYALERFMAEVPENLRGTSNPWLAHKLGLKAIGTYAHEMAMVYAGIEEQTGGNPLNGETRFLDNWESFHRGDLRIALPDTFTTDSFLDRWSAERARSWKGYRQDSGDPIMFARKVLGMLDKYNIDPQEKYILFSDGLSFPKAIDIDRQIGDAIPHGYGIGSEITSKVHPGIQPLNIVAKATHVNGIQNIKLSDDPGKHTGPQEKVHNLQRLIAIAKNQAKPQAVESVSSY